MKTYFLKLLEREEGPYAEEQVSQMFADGRADRHTPCRSATESVWKTIDDYLPMLKYGTQLPPPSVPTVRSEDPPPYGSNPPLPPAMPPGGSQRIALVDIDLPFASILKLMFKWMAAGFLVFCCFIPAVMAVVFIVMAIFGSMLGHIFSGLQRP